MATAHIDADTKHKLYQLAFRTRDRAYSPYSNFRVGAALLCDDGITMIGGCNVENASYGGTICAERTAVTKAVSEGHQRFTAVAVVSDIPTPTISPCGICRQVLREFLPLTTPIYMISSKYPYQSDETPRFLHDAAGKNGRAMSEFITEMTLEEMLPMSFGPDDLLSPRVPNS